MNEDMNNTEVEEQVENNQEANIESEAAEVNPETNTDLESNFSPEEDYNDDNFVDNHFGNSNKDLIKKLAIFMVIILIGGCSIGFILWFITLFQGNKYTYEDVEKIMTESAQSYFKDHKKNLPKEKQIVEIGVSTLVSNEYMNELTEYLGEESKCSGKVRVKKMDSKYIYTPYLNCGSKYSPIELYRVLKKKVVSSGSGLYKSNDYYIYRGERLKNYVRLDRCLWRIVKITPDNEIMLVKHTDYEIDTSWDNRYNVSTDNNVGINNYRASRLKELLYKAYNTKDKSQQILSSKDKEKLVNFSMCIGKRDVGSATKDNSEECSDVYKNQKVGVLTVSDYMYASLDTHCNSSSDFACQNYNYLNNNTSWLTATGVKSNNFEIFYIDSGGELRTQEAMSYESVRPVIMLNNSIMMKSGTGARSNPYILK